MAVWGVMPFHAGVDARIPSNLLICSEVSLTFEKTNLSLRNPRKCNKQNLCNGKPIGFGMEGKTHIPLVISVAWTDKNSGSLHCSPAHPLPGMLTLPQMDLGSGDGPSMVPRPANFLEGLSGQGIFAQFS